MLVHDTLMRANAILEAPDTEAHKVSNFFDAEDVKFAWQLRHLIPSDWAAAGSTLGIFNNKIVPCSGPESAGAD
jgi:hypothetical protein